MKRRIRHAVYNYVTIEPLARLGDARYALTLELQSLKGFGRVGADASVMAEQERSVDRARLEVENAQGVLDRLMGVQ